jgi:uncharacterized protein YprB with RNaseH-like and TPR domain
VTPVAVFLDTETTGTDAHQDRLVAVGFALEDREPRRCSTIAIAI